MEKQRKILIIFEVTEDFNPSKEWFEACIYNKLHAEKVSFQEQRKILDNVKIEEVQ